MPAESPGRFIVDAKGRRRSVVLPIKRYETLMEDLHDLAVVDERRDEGAVPLGEINGGCDLPARFEIYFSPSGERDLRLLPKQGRRGDVTVVLRRLAKITYPMQVFGAMVSFHSPWNLSFLIERSSICSSVTFRPVG